MLNVTFETPGRNDILIKDEKGDVVGTIYPEYVNNETYWRISTNRIAFKYDPSATSFNNVAAAKKWVKKNANYLVN